MRIDEIDKNLKVESTVYKEDIVWLSPKDAPISIHGLCDIEQDSPYHRLPEDIAKASNLGVESMMWHTAGGRIRFATNSPYIAINVMVDDMGIMPHMARAGQVGCDLYGYVGEKQKYIGTFMPVLGHSQDYYSDIHEIKRYSSCIHVNPEMKTYTINMPLYAGVKEIYIGLSKNAEVQPAVPYKYEKPVLYYGSSITQGGCANRPGNSYPGFIERKLDTDYINLGFSGSAKGEVPICRYLASLDVSVFVCDYDYNAPSQEHLKKTHYPLYQIFRETNPITPIIFVSRPNFTGTLDDVARRETIYDTYRIARENGDKNVYFIDGETLFGGESSDNCTVDGCHPNDLGFYRMGMVIGRVIEQILTTCD